MKRRMRQCEACPWRVGVEPARHIARYSRAHHDALASTIAGGDAVEQLAGLGATLPIMACHASVKDEACAGWLHHQLGVGNNIAVRLAVHQGRLPVPVVDGPQVASFEQTFGEGR